MGRILKFSVARAYKRWRHGRGFGIHSPFAYSLIGETLRETLPYYNYEQISQIRNEHLSARRLRLIFRLVVRFRPRTVNIVGRDVDDIVRRVVCLADSRITFDGDRPDMVIVCDQTEATMPAADVNLFLGRGRSSTMLQRIWAATQHGQRFDNGRDCSLVVSSPKLTRQQFEVKF